MQQLTYGGHVNLENLKLALLNINYIKILHYVSLEQQIAFSLRRSVIERCRNYTDF